MKTVFLRTPYNYDRDVASVESGLECTDESLAVQSEAEDADINTIVRRFGLTGQLPGDLSMPQSGDFTNIPSFHEAMNLVRRTEEEFLRVPADVRARFGNDPQAFMAFCEDDRNREEAKRLGLLRPDPVPVVQDVRIVNPSDSSAAG